MCGIIGTTRHTREQVSAALATLDHRGPDGSDIFADAHVTLGHARLSIIDLTRAGTQPMSTPNGRLWITYNGEIYNYKELREELERSGCTFVTQTDTEVIVHGYHQYGTEFFHKLRGMWALGIYDTQAHTLVLACDPFGIKPLYYTQQNDVLVFASEMRALSALGIPHTPHPEAFAAYFALGYFVAPETCYREVRMLVPGEVRTYDLATCESRSTRLSPTEERGVEPVADEAQVIEGLDAVLRESIAAHYVSDVPVGMLFSGGTDSALIAALSHAMGHTPQAYHLAVQGSTDTEYAEKIAAHLNMRLEVVRLTEGELIRQYDAVWEQLDVPFADTSIIPTSLIYKKIAGRTKVVLSGDGGDELFGGYQRHVQLAHHTQMRRHNAVFTVLDACYGANDVALQYSNPLIARLRRAYLRYGNDVIGTYLSETQTIDYPLRRQQLRDLLYENYEANGGSSPNLFFDRHLYLPNNLLFKTDAASMAASIEARLPLVDRNVHEYVYRNVPPEMCLSSRYTEKYLLKKVLERYLPYELVYREKKGFSFSFARYHVPQFFHDVQQALAFHREHADAFGLVPYRSLLAESHAALFIQKYPRFAFALVSNWKVFR